MKNKENESWVREKEYIQQVVYNEVLYLPVPKLKIKKQGATISDVVRGARISYDNGNPYNIDINDLTLLEACLKEESGISDIGNATIHYASFNKKPNELVAHGITLEEAKSITNTDAIVAVVFIYQGSEEQGIKEGVSLVFRGTPGGAWCDNANMESDCTSQFEKDGFVYDWISPLDRASLLNVEDTLLKIEEDNDDVAQLCRRFMKEGKLVLSAHSQGGKRAVTAKGIFKELQNTRCMVFDAPGISPEQWSELVNRWGVENVENMRKDIFSIYAHDDVVHGIGYTEKNGYFAKNQLVLGVPELDCDKNTNVMGYHYLFRLLHVNEDGSVRLQEEVNKEGLWAEYSKVLSDILMSFPTEKRAELMHPAMAIVQAMHARKLPHNYKFHDYLELGAKFNEFLPEIIPVLHYSVHKWYDLYLQENPFDRRPAGLGEIALKLRSHLPQEVKNTLDGARDVWNTGVDIYRNVEKTALSLPKLLSGYICDYIVEKLEATKSLSDDSGMKALPLYRMEGGLPIVQHDMTYNRCTIDLFQFGVKAFNGLVTEANDYVLNTFMDLSQVLYLDDYRLFCRLNHPFSLFINPLLARSSPEIFTKEQKSAIARALQLTKTYAYICQAVDEAMQSCEERCYPVFRIPEGGQSSRKMAELLMRQRTAEIQSGISSLMRDRTLLEASILECCGVSSLAELETDIPAKRPLVNFAKQVLYDAREIEGILLNYAARLEKGLREQFVLLGAQESAGQGAAFDTVAFLQSGSENAVSSMAAGEVGEAGIDYAAAEHALTCAADVSLHCGSLLRDIERLNERLSCLRYVSVSRDGLSELSRLLGSWKSQQEEYREALGNYVMHCRETEEQFCGRCAGIAAE
nr:hypothetical protein [uncultured Stomatobaculum sp.]